MEMLQQIGVAMAVLGGLGAFFGLVLAMANRVFYVQTDPRLDRLIQALPGANCGCAWWIPVRNPCWHFPYLRCT